MTRPKGSKNKKNIERYLTDRLEEELETRYKLLGKIRKLNNEVDELMEVCATQSAKIDFLMGARD